MANYNHKAMAALQQIYTFRIGEYPNLLALLDEENREFFAEYPRSQMLREYGVQDIDVRTIALMKALDKCKNVGCDRAYLSKHDIEAISGCDIVVTAIMKYAGSIGGFYQDMASDPEAQQRALQFFPDSDMDFAKDAKEFASYVAQLNQVRPLLGQFCEALGVKIQQTKLGL